MVPSARHPDCDALARIGTAVRARLGHDARVTRLADTRAEIYTVAHFLPALACHRLIGLIDAVAHPSGLMDAEAWPAYRTSYSGDLDPADDAVRDIDDQLSALTGIAARCGEFAQGQRYACGQYFNEHCDSFDTAAPYWGSEKCCGGQRSWTAMIYLNDVEEGGMTDFTRMAFTVPPRAGALLLWNNALPDGAPNPWTMHASRPVLRGVKYVMTKWFRARTWR